MSQNLLRSHICNCASSILSTLIAGTLSNQRDAEITEQNFLLPTHEQVRRLDIAVDQFLIVRILQCLGYLFYIACNGHKWKAGAFRVPLEQGAIKGIVHHKERGIIFHTKIE